MNTFILKDKYSSEFFLNGFDDAQKHTIPPFKPNQVLIDRKDVYEESELEKIFSKHQLAKLRACGMDRTGYPINQTIYCRVGEEEKSMYMYRFEVSMEAPDEYFDDDSKQSMFNLARKTLSQITELDNKARIQTGSDRQEEADPYIARVIIRSKNLTLWYFDTGCYVEWGVYFDLNQNEEWVYKDWG